MKKILSAYKHYNINSKDTYTGDCVKRALSLAYSMDYNEVSKELNSIKRELHKSAFNVVSVFSKFMERRGDKWEKYNPPTDPDTGEKLSTVKTFCESHPTGTYLLLTGSDSNYARGLSSHMCAVVNGDLYDSWNSYDWNVVNWSKVSSGSDIFYDTKYDEIEDDIILRISDWCKKKYVDRYSFVQAVAVENGYPSNSYTGEIYVHGIINSDVPEGAEEYANKKFGKRFPYKVNIRKSPEENVDIITKKLEQNIYDAFYVIFRDIQDLHRMNGVELHRYYYGNRTALAVLPEWSWPYVEEYNDHYNDSWHYDYGRYYVQMSPLPGDYREFTVEFNANTLKELRKQMEYYKETFSREGIDY